MSGRPKTPEERERDRARYRDNQLGIKHTVSPDAAVRRIRIWRQKGILWRIMSDRTGISMAQLQNIESGMRGYIRVGTHSKIMSARFTSQDVSKFSGLGVRRRLQALAAVGYTTVTLAEITNRDHTYIHAIMTGKNARNFVNRPVGLAVHQAYEKYASIDPRTLGQSERATTYAKNIAVKHSWGAPKDWDDDTIDDPDAWPEFTGKCGEVKGIMIHLRDGIPMCRRCTDIMNNGRRTVDPLRVFELYTEGTSSHDIAFELGVRRDLISHYVAPLTVRHVLSFADGTTMTGTCERCGHVRLRSDGRRNGEVKLVCYNSVQNGNAWARNATLTNTD